MKLSTFLFPIVLLASFTAMAMPADSTLPVELVRFEARAAEGYVTLEWVTATEQNNAGFEVQRSADGRDFERVTFMQGQGTTSTETRYEYTMPAPSTLTYYRLMQRDFTGETAYSHIVSYAPNPTMTHPRIFPNPAPNLRSVIEGSVNERYSRELLHISDATGRTVQHIDNTPAGWYFVTFKQLHHDEPQLITEKVLVTH